MLVRVAFSLALFGVALGGLLRPERVEIPNVDYFDCKPHPDDTLHVHPTDCTRFISCGNNIANDMPCALCTGNEALCPGGGYLQFDGKARNNETGEPQCEWPALSTCSNGPKPTTTSTAAPPTNGTCDATTCEVIGDCRDYGFCERIEDANDDGPIYSNGRWVTGSCAPKYYNPTLSDGTQVVVCSTWLELTQAVRDRYEADPTCIAAPCTLIPDGPCSNGYIEVYADGRTPDNIRKSCPVGEVLDVSERRCVAPSDCVAP